MCRTLCTSRLTSPTTVGALSAIGVFLFTYKVADRTLDNTLSVLAGFAVAAVALFPTGPPPEGSDLTPLQDLLSESVGRLRHANRLARLAATVVLDGDTWTFA